MVIRFQIWVRSRISDGSVAAILSTRGCPQWRSILLMWWCGVAICAAKTPTRSARLWHASEPLSRVSDLYRAEKSTYCASMEVSKGVCGLFVLFCFVGYQRWGSNETVGVETVLRMGLSPWLASKKFVST
ncbi:unnamed protein product [Brassica napus]|uniref:(rape) hypothetical protein n=1 Tax=Brassica napus TaxID=3708 RepID=A0A816L1J0_BRANA|nr:unnamed protein product [Brassica napus]